MLIILPSALQFDRFNGIFLYTRQCKDNMPNGSYFIVIQSGTAFAK